VKAKEWQWAAGLIGAAIVAGLAVTWWISPTPIVARSVSVPNLYGIASSQAIAELAEAGLRGRLAGEIEDPLVEAGAVSWQSPVAGTTLPESAVVRLGVSTGPPRILVPDVSDLDGQTAVKVLTTAGLRIGAVDSIFTAAPTGTVVRTRPDAGQPARAGAGVELTVSRGPRSTP
jgi:serine/threonine-protein kinase